MISFKFNRCFRTKEAIAPFTVDLIFFIEPHYTFYLSIRMNCIFLIEQKESPEPVIWRSLRPVTLLKIDSDTGVLLWILRNF